MVYFYYLFYMLNKQQQNAVWMH
ncbi:MAG: hypothetical protein QG651_708, partial [Pseudomonadota bacterium]|nr:hypothetical protein [Pseudomonadota bacterium]